MVESVNFEARVYKSGPQFNVPVGVRDALGLPHEGGGDGSVLYLRVRDAESGEELWSGEKQLRSGPEIYRRSGPEDVGYAISPGQHIRVEATRLASEIVKPLERYEDYSREEVHAIFAPSTPFTSQTGSWGLQGIVALPDRPGDFVFFVTLGQQQGDHVFDEGITEYGVLSWQSQPRQDLANPQIREFIEHDELTNSIYLFFRTKKRGKYTYLGKFKYLSHDAEREKPVYFQWQILDWDPPEEVIEGVSLSLLAPIEKGVATGLPTENSLRENPPPPSYIDRVARTTPTFRARKSPDYSMKDAKNRELGLRGEKLVVEHEKQMLVEGDRPDLARGYGTSQS